MKIVEKYSQLDNKSYKTHDSKKTLVIFIIGPYATKWFADSQAESAARFDNKVVWVLAPTIKRLNESLIKINEQHKNVIIRALFPFLPDGHENINAMLSSLTHWHHTFTAESFTKPIAKSIPCIFIIYARLSEERLSHDPDRAFWVGSLDISNPIPTSIDIEFKSIYSELKQQNVGINKYITQRCAMIACLFSWMEETTLKQHFQNLISISPFYLSSVVLADHGNGFIRHGAWAQWIAEKYEILPGLSSAITLPPLPPLRYVPPLRCHDVPNVPKKYFRGIWLASATVLLLVGSIIFSLLHEIKVIRTITTHINNFENTDLIHIREKQNTFNTLINDKKYLLECIKSGNVLGWGLSRCNQLLFSVNNNIEKYNKSEKYIISGSLSFFRSGSSELKPENDKELMSLLPVIKNNKGVHFLIVGHSDNTGSIEVNQKLSENRARTIRKWITDHSDIPKTNFIIKGAGDSNPIASNDTKEGREKNRRFELIPLPPEAKY